MMQSFINFIQQTGAIGFDLLWMPLVIWSVLAVVVTGLLKLVEPKVSPIYQYHGRVALLLALAVGVVGSFIAHYLPVNSTLGKAVVQPFLVIQNPVAVTVPVVHHTIHWTSPSLWVGIITAAALVLAIYGILKLLMNFISLKYFSKRLSSTDFVSAREISDKNRSLIRQIKKPIRIVFSDVIDIPCTFGMIQQIVVLPHYLQADKRKMNLALRHELMHIQSRDYLINTVVQLIRAIFFVHPLVHKFEKDIQQYREICCDRKVLQGTEVSQKNYAQLLFDLSPQTICKTSAAVNMAVQPSTLKKRIQTMKNSTHNIPPLRWSLAIMLIFVFMISGLMACSDMTDDGITKAEVQKTQAKIGQSLSGVSVSKSDTESTVTIKNKNAIIKSEYTPLFIINGEKMNTPQEREIVSRLKSGYIKSITVLKGKRAMEAYGKAGKNGVIKIELNVSKELAFSDLNAHAPDSKSGSMNGKNIYMSVKHMPKIKDYASLMKHVKYPKSCREAGIEGKVFVLFVVNKQGMPTNIHVVNGIGGGCDQAAVQAVKNYARFTPGRNSNGKPVKVQMALPISFKLPNSSSTAK